MSVSDLRVALIPCLLTSACGATPDSTGDSAGAEDVDQNRDSEPPADLAYRGTLQIALSYTSDFYDDPGSCETAFDLIVGADHSLDGAAECAEWPSWRFDLSGELRKGEVRGAIDVLGSDDGLGVQFSGSGAYKLPLQATFRGRAAAREDGDFVVSGSWEAEPI